MKWILYSEWLPSQKQTGWVSNLSCFGFMFPWKTFSFGQAYIKQREVWIIFSYKKKNIVDHKCIIIASYLSHWIPLDQQLCSNCDFFNQMKGVGMILYLKKKNWSEKVACIKLGCHMPTSYLRHSCRYCLQYPSDVRAEVTSNRGVSLNCQYACKVDLSSTLQACWQ